jgi:large subunit ribosomal protein L10
MPSEAKIATVEELQRVLEGASSIYLTDFTGMPVGMMSDLRRKCREADVEYRVVKDSLTRLAAERAGVESVIRFIDGPTALALGHSDQLAPARVLSEFARLNKLPRLRAALVEGRIFDEAQVKTLATLPSREVLLAQFAAGIMSPLTGFAGIINQMMWKLVATLEAVAKSIDSGGPAVREATSEAESVTEGAASTEGAAAGGDAAGEGGAAPEEGTAEAAESKGDES